MPYYPPYYNYCPPGYNANYSQAVIPYQNQCPSYPTYQGYQGYPNYPNQYGYKVSFTKVDAPNGEDFCASATNTTLKFLDGSNITITGKLSDYSVTVGLKETVALTGSLTLANTANLITTPVTLQTIDVSGTINTTGALVLVTSAAGITDVILGVGTVDGQHVTILNIGGFTIEFDQTDATSNVKNSSVGGSDAMIAGHAYHFVWYSTAALWYSSNVLS